MNELKFRTDLRVALFDLGYESSEFLRNVGGYELCVNIVKTQGRWVAFYGLHGFRKKYEDIMDPDKLAFYIARYMERIKRGEFGTATKKVITPDRRVFHLGPATVKREPWTDPLIEEELEVLVQIAKCAAYLERDIAAWRKGDN